MKKTIGKYIWLDCDCGSHIVDLYGVEWNDQKTGFYSCNSCDQPLVCRGEDGKFYIVGEQIE
jgi:predicted SprT family Zn-dependent metalloprotease